MIYKYGIIKSVMTIYFKRQQSSFVITIPEKDIKELEVIDISDEINQVIFVCFNLTIKIDDKDNCTIINNNVVNNIQIEYIEKKVYDLIKSNMLSRYHMLCEKYQRTKNTEFFYEYSFENNQKYLLLKEIGLSGLIKGGDLEISLKIMNLVSNYFKHNGNALLYIDKPIFETICKTKNELTCTGLAKLVCELLLIHNIKSRVIICRQKEQIDYDAHSIISVFIEEMGKWIMLDPTYNLYIYNENSIILSVPEVRNAICMKKIIYISKYANYNGGKLADNIYLKMLEKKLYRFYTTLKTYPGCERDGNIIGLVPDSRIYKSNIEIDDERVFWNVELKETSSIYIYRKGEFG